MGRPRTPVAIKLLQGNPGKRPEDLQAGIIIPAEMPDPPEGLSEAVKVKFIETAKLLVALGTMTKCDVDALVQYASHCVLLSKAYADLASNPYVGLSSTGKVQYNPAIKIVATLVPLTTKFQTEMGMTAAARSKINLGTKPKSDDTFATKFLR